VCGSDVPGSAPPGSEVPDCSVPVAESVAPPKTGMPPVARLTQTEALPPDARLCPGCGKTYTPDYADTFCTCGMELLRADELLSVSLVEEPPAASPSQPTQPGQARLLPPLRPPPGTRCLVLYGADKQPLHYFPLEKDATLIGRLDAVEGNFPDIDVNEWLDPATARKVSRKHALVLRVRANNSFLLRPLAGNTGTQLESDMVVPLADYPLTPGQRFILGGGVRFKFEIT
jgi:hypothetical protein